MNLALTSLLLFGLGAFISLALSRWPKTASRIGALVAVAACIAGLVPALQAVLSGRQQMIAFDWPMPMGQFAVGLDALGGFFLLPILLLSGLAAIYGLPYMMHDRSGKNIATSWSLYNLLAGSMVLVVLARNGVLFLLAWEIMSLSSFFLVTREDDKASVRQAGWVYLVATHVGTAMLLALFVMLAGGPSMNFADFANHLSPAAASGAFILALIGFGTKAGFMPLHVWLPRAHPAAPSHVSALMSGVMIKTGIYGLLRTLTFLGTPPAWWGYLLLGVAAVSGVMGVILALVQHDIKRLLAYHSVENIGIIGLGLGLGMIGLSYNNAALAALGFAGGLLHVLNHAIFKGLLFLGAGSVLHSAGTGQLEQLGGLIKKMPVTALAFLIGAAAICGLPPLNGFVSEFVIYFASFSVVANGEPALAIVGLVAIAALAAIGPLAAFCFAKAMGVVFLGEPRSEQARNAHESPRLMLAPMLVLAALCVLIGLMGPLVVYRMSPVVKQFVGQSADSQLAIATGPLTLVLIAALVLALLVAALAVLRRVLLRGRKVTYTGTWDCGYAAPNARMQYTASSFAWPILHLLGWVLGTRRKFDAPSGNFPAKSEFETHTDDPLERRVFAPVFSAIGWMAAKARFLQQGRIQLYVLYIAVVLLALVIWMCWH